MNLWETVSFDERGFVVSRTEAVFAATALIPEDQVSELPGMHFEHVEHIHSLAKNRQGEDGPQYLFKRKA